MDELKPCPFCGSENVAFTLDDEQQMENTETGFIWCHGCGFSSDSYYNLAKAIDAWNRRADLEAENEKLRQSKEELRRNFANAVRDLREAIDIAKTGVSRGGTNNA